MTQLVTLDAHTHIQREKCHGKTRKAGKANASWPLEDSSNKKHLGSSRLRPTTYSTSGPKLKTKKELTQESPKRNEKRHQSVQRGAEYTVGGDSTKVHHVCNTLQTFKVI